jgi:hypothetical protein
MAVKTIRRKIEEKEYIADIFITFLPEKLVLP